jgi:hypothetical protein
MKKNILIVLAILFSQLTTTLFFGCSLEENSILYPVADDYFKTEIGAKKLLNSCYSYTRYWGGYFCFHHDVQGTDLYLHGGDGGTTFGRYEILPNDFVVAFLWNPCYSGITACNTFLSRADDIDASSDLVNVWKGEALFIRALFYHLLVINFGGVPLQLDEVTSVVTTAVRATEQEVYDQIIKDLQEAESLLPPTQSDYGRATKAAVQALLARVYLWNQQWVNAATYAKKVIDSGQFELLADYADLWHIDNQQNEEIIWAVNYTQNIVLNGGGVDGAGNLGNNVFLMRYDIRPGMMRDMENGRPFRYHMPSRYFMDLCAANQWWDSRFDKGFTYTWYANNPANFLPEMTLGDTAVFVPPYAVSEAQKERTKNRYSTYDINFYFDGEVPLGPRETFPSITKFMDPKRPNINDPGTRDFPVFRLAEMYLIAAEALMMDGKASEGVEYINAIRRRGAWNDELYEQAKLSAAQLTIDAILEERALELTGECVGRWADLKRTGKLVERVKLYNPDARGQIQDYHVLRPIPQTLFDRVTNKEELHQNPGY